MCIFLTYKRLAKVGSPQLKSKKMYADKSIYRILFFVLIPLSKNKWDENGTQYNQTFCQRCQRTRLSLFWRTIWLIINSSNFYWTLMNLINYLFPYRVLQTRVTCDATRIIRWGCEKYGVTTFSKNQSRLINLPEPCDKKIRAVRFS